MDGYTDPAPGKGPPVADAKGPYSGLEGVPITFDASESTDPDSDALQYRWDFESDGNWDTPWSSDPIATYVWGDDWAGTATLAVEDTDGNLTVAITTVTIDNVAPTIGLSGAASVNEGSPYTLTLGAVADPGPTATACSPN